MRIAKAKSALKSISHPEALDLAIAYGWIDALKKSEGSTSWLQRWTPRKPKGLWSKINTDKAIALIESGRMKSSGMAEVEKAKADGRWDAAYQGSKAMEVPSDLLAALDKSPTARDFFDSLDRANRYAILWRLQTAPSPAARQKRLEKFVDMLVEGKRIHEPPSR